MYYIIFTGEIPECEYVKSLLGKIARNSFAASLGVNDDWSAALSLAAMVEVLLIIGTLLVKVVSNFKNDYSQDFRNSRTGANTK